MTVQQSTTKVDINYPKLPEPKYSRIVDGLPCITIYEHQHLMRAYVDADRAARATPAQAADSVLEDAEIDRIVPALEPVSEDFPAEWAVWKDRERIREELRAARKQGANHVHP